MDTFNCNRPLSTISVAKGHVAFIIPILAPPVSFSSIGKYFQFAPHIRNELLHKPNRLLLPRPGLHREGQPHALLIHADIILHAE